MPENEYALRSKDFLVRLGEILPVRQRYVFTRSNRLRLRYVLPAAACCLTLAAAGLAGSVPPKAPRVADIAALSPNRDEAGEKLALMQKRMERYDSAVDITEEDEPRVEVASVAPPKPAPRPEPREKTVKIGKGDTLAGVLQKAGVEVGDAYKAVLAMEDVFDPRKIRPGQEVHVRFDPLDEKDYEFSQLQIGLDALRSLYLTRGGDGEFKSAVKEKDVVTRTYANRADIKLSLYGSAALAGIPAPVIAQAIHIYSWDVDFQRDIRRGDSLEVLYNQYETEDGDKVKNGDILYARLNVNGTNTAVYRYEKENGDVDYYTRDGKSVRKALLQTPVDGARISSTYGEREHPILGYTLMHKGIDFAVARGTPIFAAGDGTIEKAFRYGSYGNYVRIRHNSTLKTAYAHMMKFASGIHPGVRVKQGQVIGYVGTTGRSTGPHVHYEVLVNDKQVNPKSVKLQQGDTLKGTELAAFKKHVADIDRQYASLTTGTKLASRNEVEDVSLR